MENSTNNQIVTSFRANGNNWKKLKDVDSEDTANKEREDIKDKA